MIRPMETRSSRILRGVLLLAGLLASMVYITADIVCGLRYPGYSFTDQVISELSAIGAPTTALWVRLLQVFAVLFTAFTIGVIRESRGNRRLRFTGWLLVAFVLTGPLWSFVPMHQRGDVFAWTDVGHIALGAVMVLLVTSVIAVGAGALGRRFRVFSQVLVAVAVVSGVGTFAYVPRMIGQLPTPWVGTVERIHLYGFWVWIGVLAIALLSGRHRRNSGDRSPARTTVAASAARMTATNGPDRMSSMIVRPPGPQALASSPRHPPLGPSAREWRARGRRAALP